jgi:hypothetical protein
MADLMAQHAALPPLPIAPVRGHGGRGRGRGRGRGAPVPAVGILLPLFCMYVSWLMLEQPALPCHAPFGSTPATCPAICSCPCSCSASCSSSCSASCSCTCSAPSCHPPAIQSQLACPQPWKYEHSMFFISMRFIGWRRRLPSLL